MTEDIILAIERNPNFEICININLKITNEYLEKSKYKYPYSRFGVDILGKEYGKIYSGNEDNELTYSLDEFKQYFDIYECNDIHESILSVDISDIFNDENIEKDRYENINYGDDIIKCKLSLQDISYSDKIIYLEAEINN